MKRKSELEYFEEFFELQNNQPMKMCLNILKGEIIMNTSNITNYKPKDFAELLGVSVKTLQRWDREGTLKANRTPTDRRYYTYDQYLQFKGINTENDNVR